MALLQQNILSDKGYIIPEAYIKLAYIYWSDQNKKLQAVQLNNISFRFFKRQLVTLDIDFKSLFYVFRDLFFSLSALHGDN